MLSVRIAHRFDARFSLELSFEAPRGVTALIGPSGSGKTSTLQIIAGLLPPDSADIRLDGTSWSTLPPERRNVSLVFQSLALFPHLTVRENVKFGPSTSDALASEWLERMKVSHLADRKPASLSGGEAQRVALARAFARRPAVLLLDEPFSALDDTLRVELIAELKTHLAALNVPTLLVTHDARDLTALATRTISIAHGRTAP